MGCRPLGAVLVLCGCSFESGGTMSGGASADVGETGDVDTTDGTTTSTAGDSADDEAVDETTTTTDGGGGQAVLELDADALLDFADVDVQTMQSHALMLTNTGTAPATAIDPSTPAAPFGFLGGMWPGNGGDCGAVLDPGASCSIELAFSPLDFGIATAVLSIDYHDGLAETEVELPLAGRGIGATANLLVNGDGEMGGMPPPGWDPVAGLYWRTSDMIPPHGGALSITADAGPNGEFVLQQTVALAQWSTLVDEAALSVTFDGWSRAYDGANDLHWFVVDYLDADGVVLDTFETTPHLMTAWTQVTDARLAPVGTRAVNLHLHCTKTAGGYCDGYFDDMSITATYP